MDTATQQMMRSRNAANRFQGEWPRVLCVCSAGLLRSPTLAWVLSNDPYNCNTRAAGSHLEYALVPLDQVLIDWACAVVFANRENHIRAMAMKLTLPEETYVLNVPDRYEFRHPELVAAIRAELESAGFPYRYAERATDASIRRGAQQE
jgi:predicted protein tyrosine phosphatase